MSSNTWLRIGWRNLARNPKRTVITALGLAVGYFAVVFLVGWMQGITAELVENTTGLVGGQIEIHASEYRPERSLYETIGGRDGVDVSEVLRVASSDASVVAAAPRVYAGGLVSSGDATSAGMLMGVDPELEPKLSRFLNELTDGRLPVPGRREILVGSEMARQLAVGVGDDVVVVAPGADGSMGNDLYQVVGIFQTELVTLDASYAVLPIEDLQSLVVLDAGRVHEIAVSTADPWIAPETATRLSDALGLVAPDVVVAPWTDLHPVIVEYVALVDAFYLVIFGIVFLVAMFGIANTMLMSTFERRREFAVMLALGTTPTKVVLAVLHEAVAMGVLSLVIGAGVTIPIMVWWHNAPPDLAWLTGGLPMAGTLLRPTLRVEYDFAVWVQASLALLATAVLAALYPAARAARIPPADTLSGV